MNTGCFFLFTETVSGTPFLLAWWFHLLVLALVLIAGYCFYRIKMNNVLHQRAELEGQLLQRTELLTYAKQSAQKAEEDAAAANRNKSALLSKISHDIRTPMNTIMGMSALLNETPLNAEQQEFTSNILYSGDHLLSAINEILMNDILEYSRIDSGRELEARDFDLRSNIEEVFDVFALKAAQANIELLYFIDSDVPVQLIGDALRVRQILMNLIENALHFTVKGEIFIVVKLAEKLTDNRVKLAFEVRDTSAGLAPQVLEEVVKDLKSDSETSNTSIGKTLTICKKLIRLMGGSLTIKNNELQGNTYQFSLITSFGKQNSRANTQVEMEKMAGKKILVVDDSVTLGNTFKTFFERWKLLPFIANSGAQSLEILAQETNFDLAIIDMAMPEMNGIELSKTIKITYPDLPIILMNKAGNEIEKNDELLFNAVVDKPLKHHQIKEKLVSALQKGKENTNTSAADQAVKPKLSVEFAKQYPLNILVAEDDKMNQKLVTKILNKLGYEPQISENGKEVLEVVSNKNYDLILMDVQMPEMDGLEATRMIRVCLTEQPVIIAMTANTLQGDRENCLKAGMDDYIAKPVRLDNLVNIIEKWALQSRIK